MMNNAGHEAYRPFEHTPVHDTRRIGLGALHCLMEHAAQKPQGPAAQFILNAALKGWRIEFPAAQDELPVSVASIMQDIGSLGDSDQAQALSSLFELSGSYDVGGEQHA